MTSGTTSVQASPAQTSPAQRVAVACFFVAAMVSLTGVLGVLLGSVPDINDRLGIDPMPYWNDRLLASLLLGVAGLSFGTIVTFLGASLATSRDPGRRDAGRLVLGVSVLPHLAGVVSLLALTPDDWSHTITHVVAVVLIGAGFLVLRGRRREG